MDSKKERWKLYAGYDMPECGRKISCDDDLTDDYKFCPFCGLDTREDEVQDG